MDSLTQASAWLAVLRVPLERVCMGIPQPPLKSDWGVYGQSAQQLVSACMAVQQQPQALPTVYMAMIDSTDGAALYGHTDMNGAYTTAGVYGRSDGDNGFGVVGHNYWAGVGIGAWSYTGRLIDAFSGDYPDGLIEFYSQTQATSMPTAPTTPSRPAAWMVRPMPHHPSRALKPGWRILDTVTWWMALP